MNQQPNLKQVGNYLIFLNKKLGEGQYGQVYEAQYNNEKSPRTNDTTKYAVKVIPASVFQQSYSNQMMIQQEIGVLKKLQHENIVCLIEIQQSTNNLYLFLDYCNGGDLNDYIMQKEYQRLSESESVDFFHQMIQGYQYLYSQKIVHRDLKPENLMLHNGKIKIGDFGFGRFVEGEMDIQQRMSIKCTPIYASPQLLNKQDYSSKCDVWSAGCIFYKMLYGQYPFIAKDLNSLMNSIRKKVVEQEFQFPSQPLVSEDVKTLIRKMLQFEEKDRISWEELFKHPLMQKQYNILSTSEEKLEDSDKNNPIYQSIIQNREEVKDKVVSDYANNFTRFANQAYQKEFENKYHNIDPQPQQIEAIIPKVDSNSKIQTEQQLQLNNIITLQNYIPKQDIPVSVQQYVEKPQYSFQQNNNINYLNLELKDINNNKVKNVDKMILFMRNQALFADVTMQLIFTSRKNYSVQNVLFYDIIFCLTGCYNLNLDLLNMIMQQKVQVRLVKKEDFELYLKSEEYLQTKEKIEKDANTALSFYQSLVKGILKETGKYFVNDIYYQYSRDLEEFVKSQPSNSCSFKQRLQSKVKNFISQININNIKEQLNALRGIRALQIFVKMEKYIPIQNYSKFDFRLFYDNEINNLSLEQLYERIIKEENI